MRLADFTLAASDFSILGSNLQRPECVWVDAEGIWVSDARGGIARLGADGAPRLLGSGILEPNGFSRRPDGSFVVAGIADGGLHQVEPGGATRLLLNRFGGRPLGAVNYACADGPGRIWLSVMTRGLPWHTALSARHVDGYILRIDLHDESVAHCEIVADHLDLTNEVKVAPDGRHLYAVETFGSRVVRFAIGRDGSLGDKETVGPETLGADVLPDGLTFDAFGNLWVTVINQNGITVIDRQGNAHSVYRDPNAEAVDSVRRAVEQRHGTVEQLAACASVSGPLRLPTSLAFSADGRTAYVGSVGLPHLATFRLPAQWDP